jgi:hypothetical protein
MIPGIQPSIRGVVALCIGIGAGSAGAATARAPHAGTVLCAYASPSGYLEVGNVSCTTTNHRAMLVGTWSYRYYGGCPNGCTGSTCNGGAGNYYVVTGANGWDFRQHFFNSNSYSFSKTCDSCVLGLVGATGSATSPRSRSDNRQYGTRMSSWMSPSLSCGQSLGGTEIVGYPSL